MIKTSLIFLGAIVGGVVAIAGMVLCFGWGTPYYGQVAHLDPTRSDYVDLLLTLMTIFLAAIGLAVTVGALVIGLVALKTLREIKNDAANSAQAAAEAKISETITEKLEPNVIANVRNSLPPALRIALLDEEIGHKILTDMARKGVLDPILERLIARLQAGGNEFRLDEDTDNEK
ncbi:MAG: hypothetical protein OXC26_11750 [Albidovulum sp.]|nr:hypothetical protein [Albidovulum sp.]